MSADATTLLPIDSVIEGAAVLAGALGLGDQALPIDDWPVDDGDQVIAATVVAASPFRVFLAAADPSGLLADSERLAQVLATAAQTMLGDTGEIAVRDIATTVARPSVFVGLFADDVFNAAFGVASLETGDHLADVDDIDSLTAPGRAAVYEPVALQGRDDARAFAPGPLELLNDVDMEVTAELGRTTMPIRELLALQPGTVVEIDRAAGAPIDVLVNGRRIASGEVVVIDEEFGIRITEIVAGEGAG
ncbi:MAG: flagellar motor switch protein FliN [Ilumatobacter sp.]|uniref:flagellar motor switch protein FliN n=1 Tax=Ilumatobacter sp. TaxID=1967498 RepID=UPI00262247D8|nr:flagellar motor switch protein FliN [Ilumatobacter sp.]MDJ0767441.1 flagellar motor switch protein FliN [Ilumatobacter sp.]